MPPVIAAINRNEALLVLGRIAFKAAGYRQGFLRRREFRSGSKRKSSASL
jgi:hypothetical protein